MTPVRVVCIADTHTYHRQLVMPQGDVLVVAGDFTARGRLHEIEDFDAWLAVQPYKVKIVVAGNHDRTFESSPASARRCLTKARYLEDAGMDIRPSMIGRSSNEGWKITVYGSPWQPKFYDWAFNLPRNGEAIASKWRKIPTSIDVLITHGPPFGVLDWNLCNERAGCERLAEELERIRPRLHVFGHLHTPFGVLEYDGTIFVNAAMCDDRYEIHREPIVVELPVEPADRR